VSWLPAVRDRPSVKHWKPSSWTFSMLVPSMQRVPCGCSNRATCQGFGWNEVRAEKKQKVEIARIRLVQGLPHVKTDENLFSGV
jgi:hypothetical protein